MISRSEVCFPGQISYTLMSILEGEILRTSLPYRIQDELIDSLIWAYEDEVEFYLSLIEANKLLDLDERYCEILKDPRQ